MSRILIVEDDLSLGKVLQTYLKSEGHEADWLTQADKATGQLQSQSYDAVLLDIRLGSQSGLELLQSWQSAGPLPPVLVMTGENTPENAIDAMGQGAFDYLVKPFDLATMAGLLTKAIAQAPRIRGVAAGSADSGPVLVGRSEAMQTVYKKIGLYSRHDGTVLIQGESGVGKELVANAIHRRSNRASGPFVAINMSAIPDTLLESELFGYEKGAFTGADRPQPGKFRQAEGGTLFLDEIGDMPLAVQAKLLRVLQEREVTPIGSVKTYPINVRIIAATQVELAKAVEAGKFRQDLFFRLNVLPLRLPALRERKDDIPELVESFLARKPDTAGKRLSARALARLKSYDWPGNVRELQNVIERVALLASVTQLDEAELAAYSDLPLGSPSVEMTPLPEAAFGAPSFEQMLQPLVDDLVEADSHSALEVLLGPMEKIIIERALLRMNGNQIRVADFLGVNRNTLRKRIKDLAIDVREIKTDARATRRNGGRDE